MAIGKTNVDLGPVQETLLIPLLGRAFETRRPNGLIHDPRAVEIVDSLDYDFQKWNERSVAGASLRTRMFDAFVQLFLDAHPRGTVVEIGCGLNTRFSRVDNGQVRWLDLDLPDVIALRRQFFEDEPRCTMVAASVLDTEWMDEVAALEGPVMFVSEAVLIYLEAPEARRALEQIAARFATFWLALDTTSRSSIAGQARGGPMKKLPRQSWFRWECNDPKEIETWVHGLRMVQSQTFLEADPELLQRLRMPVPFGWLFRAAPWAVRWMVSGYRLNLFQRDLVENERQFQ